MILRLSCVNRHWTRSYDYSWSPHTRRSRAVSFLFSLNYMAPSIANINPQPASHCRMWQAPTPQSTPAPSSGTTTSPFSKTLTRCLGSCSWAPARQWRQTDCLTSSTCAGQACRWTRAAPPRSRPFIRGVRVFARGSRTCLLWGARMSCLIQTCFLPCLP